MTVTDSWVSCPTMTGFVRTKNRIIVDTCPAWSWAKGKRFKVLVKWLCKFGPVEIAPLQKGTTTQGSLF